MKASTVLFVALFGLTFNYCTVHCYNCNFISEDTGTIFVRQDVHRNSRLRRCWEISVPEDYALHLKIAQFDLITQNLCDSTPSYYYETTTTSYPPYVYKRASLKIQDGYNDVIYTVKPSDFNRTQLIVRGDANFTLEVDNNYNWCLSHKVTLRLEFSKVTGIGTLGGVIEARDKVVTWMRKQLLPPLKWHDDIEKMVIALHLSDGMNFSRAGLVEELLIKQVDLKSSVALLRNASDTASLSLNKLAKIVNSLLVTCHNPRKFYGYDLLKVLKEKVEEPTSIPSPLAYIALCNANETLTNQTVQKLLNAVRQHEIHSEYPFSSDISALALMALSCVRNRNNEVRENTKRIYNGTLEHLKKQQQEDGSFGNIYSTAVITQALMSSNADNRSIMIDTVFPAIKFLVDHLNTSDLGLMAAYYTLPILNGKTLLDISYTDCSSNPRRDRDGSDISDIIGDSGEKIKVKYSLIIGDKEDITNTLTLRVPDNTTAYDVMRIAQTIEPRYRFQWKRMSGKMYVYEIAGIPVDPEEGRFWLTYFKNDTSTELKHVLSGLDQLSLHNGYHLIQWYKSVHF